MFGLLWHEIVSPESNVAVIRGFSKVTTLGEEMVCESSCTVHKGHRKSLVSKLERAKLLAYTITSFLEFYSFSIP